MVFNAPAALRAFVAPICVFTGVLTGCLPVAGDLPAPLRVSATVRAEYVVAAADAPVALAFAPDGRVFYAEKNTGRIRVIQDGVLLADAFAAVPVNSAGERGLVGLALHPNFANNGRVYAFYTRSDTGNLTSDPQAALDNRVVFFESSGNVADGGEVFVASFPAGGTTNIGGRIAFGPDDRLYVALGDLNNEAGAQDVLAPAGKLLRLSDDGSVPADNPAVGSNVFARGVRDVRGLTFDPVSQSPFLLDLNPFGEHEINRVLGGSNLGWAQVTGQAVFGSELDFATANGDYLNPLLDTGAKSNPLIGLSFNPSGLFGPVLRDHLFYAESNARRIIELQLSTDRFGIAGRTTFAEGFPSAITDVAFTSAGTLYVATVDAIFKLTPIDD